MHYLCKHLRVIGGEVGEDFAVKFLMNLDEETRKQIIDTVVDLTKFDHPPCHLDNTLSPPLPDGQILPVNDMAADEVPAS